MSRKPLATDAQIRELLASTTDIKVKRLCKLALNIAPTYLRGAVVLDARRRITKIIQGTKP